MGLRAFILPRVDMVASRRLATEQRKRAALMRLRARRQRRNAAATLERLSAPLFLAALAEDDLSELEDVRPALRLVPGGRA
jgi:hypothetical protein